jgi:hypothetical protein
MANNLGANELFLVLFAMFGSWSQMLFLLLVNAFTPQHILVLREPEGNTVKLISSESINFWTQIFEVVIIVIK